MARRKKKEAQIPLPQEPETQGISESLELEDILRDFSAPAKEDMEAPTPPAQEEAAEPEEATEPIQVESVEPAPAEEPAEGDSLQDSALRGDTVRLDRTLLTEKAAQTDGKTIRFSIPDSETAANRTVEGETVRIYAGAQEDASPPLKVLEKKQKISSGPKPLEKQYEEAAMGLGGAQARLFVAALLTGISLVLTALAAFHVLNFSGGVSFLPFLQLVLLLLTALMTYDVAVEGLLHLFRLRPDERSVLVVLLIFSLVDSVQCILEGRTSFGALTGLCLTTSLWADCQNRSRVINTLEVIRRGAPIDAAVREPSFYEGKDGILRKSGDLDTFLQDQERAPGAIWALRIYEFIALVAAAVLSGLTCGGSIFTFARTFTAMLLAATPAMGLTAVSRPRAAAAQRLKVHGAALSGWVGAKNLRGSVAVPLGDQDLFPSDKLRMNGMKLYPEVDPDQTIAYGTAAICASGSGLSRIFSELRDRRNLRSCKVQNLRRYDNGGISAEIGQDSVLAGSLPFMQAMGVEMPQGTKVNQAVYVAVNGFLGGVFAISYSVSKASVGGLGTLSRSAKVTPVLTAQDFVITPAFLHSRFRVNTSKIEFPTLRERAALQERKPSEDARQCAILTRSEFSSLAKAVSCGRAMYSSALWGTIVSILAGVIGLGMTGVLAWLGSIDLMSAENLLLYVLLWSVPLWILGGLVQSA